MKSKQHYAFMALLPFTMRKRLRAIAATAQPEAAKTAAITAMFEEMSAEVERLYHDLYEEALQGRIQAADADVVLSVCNDLVTELYQSYDEFVSYMKGAEKMTTFTIFTDLERERQAKHQAYEAERHAKEAERQERQAKEAERQAKENMVAALDMIAQGISLDEVQSKLHLDALIYEKLAAILSNKNNATERSPSVVSEMKHSK